MRADDTTLLAVDPTGPLWDEYVERMLGYLDESWPTLGLSRSSLDSDLRVRWNEGGRGLFFLGHRGARPGIANVYITDRSLHIAEFSIASSARRAGLGRILLDWLIDWGRRQGCERLVVEVDRDLAGANAFWSRQRLTLDASGERHLFFAPIAPVQLVWIRHAAVATPPEAPRLPDRRSLTIFSSPLPAARETAAALASDRAQVVVVPELAEYPLPSESAEEGRARVVAVAKQLAKRALPHGQRILVSHERLHHLFALTLEGADRSAPLTRELQPQHASRFDFDPRSETFRTVALNEPPPDPLCDW
jgi:GNAT superfamily N-acetyltransferase